MKKIFCLLLCAIITVTSVSYTLAENSEEQLHHPDSNAVAEAQSLLCAISDNDMFSSVKSEPVTRGQFAEAVMELLSLGDIGEGDLPFEDISSQNSCSDAVYGMLQMGLISSGKYFRPNDEITFNEAVKIAVSAMGYSQLAGFSGGYPTGYLKIANDRDVLENLEDTGVFTCEHMIILLYNMLRGEIPETEYMKSDSVRYSYNGTSLLYSLYGIMYTEGIITKTFATSYDIGYGYQASNSVVEVDGKAFKSEVGLYDYFGMNCIVYYTEKENKIVSAYPADNREFTVSLENVYGIDGGNFRYYTEDTAKLKSLKIEKNYIEVYNGKTTYADKKHLSEGCGFVRLADNNNDGTYDIIFISSYSYTKVKNIDVDDRVIEDLHDSNSNIVIDENDVLYTVKNSEGKFVRIADIKDGDVLSVTKSLDSSVVSINIMGDMLYGEVEAITEEGRVVIGEKEYTLSDYAKKHCANELRLGMALSFYPGFGGEIAYFEFSSDSYAYGYVTETAKQTGFDDDFRIKLYSQAGIMKIYDFAEKVTFNGKKDKASDVYGIFTQNFEPQLIRYRLGADGKISSIDTAEIMDMQSATLEEMEMKKSEDDCLTQNVYGASSYSFRSSGSFDNFFNGNEAVIFIIPVMPGTSNVVDTDNEEEFDILSVSQIRSGTTYSYFDVYDVNEFGQAKAIVGYSVERTSSPHSFRSALTGSYTDGMISQVRRGISSEGETGYQVEICKNGKFNKYFMSDDVRVLLPEGDKLSVGDVVRYKLADDEIEEIIVDINADKLSNNRTWDNRSVAFNGGDTFLTYQIGQLYSYNTSVCNYSVVSDEKNGIYDFSPANIRNAQMRTNNICRYDSKTNTVKSISISDLRSYKVYSDMADIIALKQQNLSTQAIYVFGKGDE